MKIENKFIINNSLFFGAILLFLPIGLSAQHIKIKPQSNEVTITGGHHLIAESKSFSTKPAIINSVSPRFKVASADYSTDGIVKTVNWEVATKEACDCQNIDGETGWRLPTKHELMFIYSVNNQLKYPLETVSSGGEPLPYYWSSTHQSDKNAWFIAFSIGALSSAFSKEYLIRVRCIKDL